MATRYSAPSVEAILEDSEDDSEREKMGEDADSANESSRRHKRSSHDPNTKSGGRDKERRRVQRSSNGNKPTPKSKSKTVHARRPSDTSRRDSGSDAPRLRLRHTIPSRSASSSSNSSSDEDETTLDHRAVLAASRARLTSPSMISTITSQTTCTNKSSSSSGSNSTVTQASMTKRPTVGKKPEISEAPLSPAVPDAPDVFAFLEKDPKARDSDDDDDEEAGEDPSQWPPTPIAPYVESALPLHISTEHASASSSSSSSFNGSDNFSEPAAENDRDTDRSTSPERSVKGQDDPPEVPLSPAEMKFASQMAAAQQRQHLYGQFGTPNMPRGTTNLPHIPSSALSARHQYQIKQQILPRAEKLPVTGYELLASRLASFSSGEPGTKIKPMYRKFEALNHRLLLHLQDELSELEEQLHRLDNADTQSRRTDRLIIPASRRAAAQAGGELQWHKTDVLGRIGYKLNQYNQALSSFNGTQSLSPPALTDIDTYRSYLQREHPIAESETHFLDPADDLVSIYSEHIPPSLSSQPESYASSSAPSSSSQISVRSSQPISSVSKPHLSHLPRRESSDYDPEENSTLPALATAVAVAVLLPILTFSVIPGFIGRMTVTALVGAGVLGALIQSGILASGIVLESEGVVCAGIYGAVMVVVAGVVC